MSCDPTAMGTFLVVFCLRLNALLCTSVREIICLSDQEGQPVSWPSRLRFGGGFLKGGPGGVGIGYRGLVITLQPQFGKVYWKKGAGYC